VIFTFGSNLAGRHGKGAALFAWKNHGAVYGQGVGPQGNAYAIPTKDASIRTLPLVKIKPYVEDFITYARANPTLKFQVTRIGCGLAGYKDSDIAPMFKGVPPNCEMPTEWVGLY
jgi:hypothetical protein